MVVERNVCVRERRRQSQFNTGITIQSARNTAYRLITRLKDINLHLLVFVHHIHANAIIDAKGR
jgi:hypothetical protein